MYVTDYLQSRRVPFVSLLHRPVSSATRRAGSVHVPGQRVAKAVLVKTGETFAIALLPSTRWIDLGKLSDVVGSPRVQTRLATGQEVAEMLPDCEPGVVPPVGRLYGLPTLVDMELDEEADLIIGGNMRHEGLQMKFRDFEAVAEPIRGSFSQPIACDQPRAEVRGPDRLAG